MRYCSAICLCVVFTLFINVFSRPQEKSVSEGFSDLSRRLQKIKERLQGMSDIIKNIGSNDTIGHVNLCEHQYFGPNVQSKTTSYDKLKDGSWYTINETTWKDRDGEEVAYYRVTAQKNMDASIDDSTEEVVRTNRALTKPIK